MVLTYSGKSRPSAQNIAQADPDIRIKRSNYGDINWGRSSAYTRLNPNIRNVTNKRVMRELFASHNVPTPYMYTNLNSARLAIVQGEVLVGRPDQHTKGRGFWLIRSLRDFDKALRGTRKKKPATHFMAYIDAPREYRVHVFRGQSIRISEKLHTEFHKYTTIKPTHSVKHVRRAAKSAIQAVGLDFGAVDVLANDEECWVLEVNAAPGLGGSMPALYAEHFNRFMEEETWQEQD